MDEWENTPLEGFERWDSFPSYPVENWKTEVANNETRYGYWSWVKDRLYWDEIVMHLRKSEQI